MTSDVVLLSENRRCQWLNAHSCAVCTRVGQGAGGEDCLFNGMCINRAHYLARLTCISQGVRYIQWKDGKVQSDLVSVETTNVASLEFREEFFGGQQMRTALDTVVCLFFLFFSAMQDIYNITQPIITQHLLPRLEFAKARMSEPWMIVRPTGDHRLECGTLICHSFMYGAPSYDDHLSDKCKQVLGLCGFKCRQCGEDICIDCAIEKRTKVWLRAILW